MPHVLLYTIPKHKRMHHSSDFVVSDATFTLRLNAVTKAFQSFVERAEANATKYIAGQGEKDEQRKALSCLRELEKLNPQDEAVTICSESVSAFLAYALGTDFHRSIVSVNCHPCDISYKSNKLQQSTWKESHNGGYSRGTKLTCPRNHTVYADILEVLD